MSDINRGELNWKVYGRRGGRPSIILDWILHSKSGNNDRHIVLPIRKGKYDKQKPLPYGIKFTHGDKGELSKGEVNCASPFGLSTSALPNRIDSLYSIFNDVLHGFDRFLSSSDNNKYKPGDLVTIRVDKKTIWAIIMSGAHSPLGMISVFWCSTSYEDISKDSTIFFPLTRDDISIFDNSYSNLLPDMLFASLLIVRTISEERVIDRVGSVTNYENGLIAKFVRLIGSPR